LKVENDLTLSGAPFLRMLPLELRMPLVLENAFWRIENASHVLRMPLEELKMLLTLFKNASRRIENASHALRMLFEELGMLLAFWECFSKNWKYFSRFENDFRRIENAFF
jgi:hypothetical protein